MREECKHFQSRTYSSGEVARFCVLDLAPEAPWRCPENCPCYERRLAAAGGPPGNLADPPVEDDPDMAGSDIASLLDAAEIVVEQAAPGALAEAKAREQAAKGGGKGVL